MGAGEHVAVLPVDQDELHVPAGALAPRGRDGLEPLRVPAHVHRDDEIYALRVGGCGGFRPWRFLKGRCAWRFH